jgi:hypothetical protein
MKKTKTTSGATVCVLKVALKHKQTIWRRIAIRSDQTLDDLHWAIFKAFDREEDHLYSFYLSPPGLKGRAAMVEAAEYTHPFALEGAPFDDERCRNAEKTTIGSLRLSEGRQFRYLFDFGDSWEHELKVEAADQPLDPSRKYPVVVEKNSASPPQYLEVEGE